MSEQKVMTVEEAIQLAVEDLAFGEYDSARQVIALRLSAPLDRVREALEESKRELHRVGACEGGVFDDIELPHSCYFLDAALSLLPKVQP